MTKKTYEKRRHNALLNCQICDRFHDINFHVFLYILFIFYVYHHCLYIFAYLFDLLSLTPSLQKHVSKINIKVLNLTSGQKDKQTNI